MPFDPEPIWIRELRKQVEALNEEDAGIWSNVEVGLCLGDARRLLYCLDRVKEVDGSEEAADELYLLATGAMEG